MASPVASERVMLPRKLTAENGAKYALIGEFFEQYEYVEEDEDGELVRKTGTVPVQWDTIKRIWDRAVAHFEALDKQEGGSMVRDPEVPHGPEPTT